MKAIAQLTAILSLFVFYRGNAQTYKNDSLENPSTTISMDPRVEELLNGLESKCKSTNLATSSRGTTNTNASTRPASGASSRPIDKADLCRKNPRLMGYKILIAVVRSKAEADNISAEFRKSFPAFKVEVDASLRPNYKIMAGSYFTKEGIKKDLARVRQTFNGAVVIQYMIFCSEAR